MSSRCFSWFCDFFTSYWKKEYHKLSSSLSVLERKVKEGEDNSRVVTDAYKKARRKNRDYEKLMKRCGKLQRQRDCLHKFIEGARYLIPEGTDMQVHNVLHEITEEEIS